MIIEKHNLNRRMYLNRVYGLVWTNFDTGFSLWSRGIGRVVIEQGSTQTQPYMTGKQRVCRTDNDGVIRTIEIEYKIPTDVKNSDGLKKLVAIASKEYFDKEMHDAYMESGFKFNP